MLSNYLHESHDLHLKHSTVAFGCKKILGLIAFSLRKKNNERNFFDNIELKQES